MVKVPLGWTVETEPPALIVLDSEWKERHRLRLISFSGNQQVSAVGTAEVELAICCTVMRRIIEFFTLQAMTAVKCLHAPGVRIEPRQTIVRT